jgi:hypothetical protein
MAIASAELGLTQKTFLPLDKGKKKKKTIPNKVNCKLF